MLDLLLGIKAFKDKIFENHLELYTRLSQGQSPETFVITCGDSRVVINELMQKGAGDLFSIRNIGNLVPSPDESSSEAAALQYADNALNIKRIIVLGHSGCGAMLALLNPKLQEEMPAVYAWLRHARPVLEKIDENERKDEKMVNKLAQLNVVQQLDNLKKFPWISRRLEEKTLTLHGWFYDIGEGHISIYDASIGQHVSFNNGLKTATINTRNQCILDIVQDYLTNMIAPQSAEEYQSMCAYLLLLEKNLESIWPKFAAQIEDKLWQKFGEKYPLYSSKDDQAFIDFMNEGKQIKLPNLEQFKHQLKESIGYQAYCKEHDQHRLFKAEQAEKDTHFANVSEFGYP